MGSRSVRFSKQDESLIQEFLEQNTVLDFSTLARIAIINFIKKPELNLTPAGIEKDSYKIETLTQ